MTYPIKVAVMYDHLLIRHGIIKVLDELGYEVIFQATTEREVFQQLESQEPDIIVIVVNIETIDNFETIHEITFRYPKIGVVALSMRDDDGAIVRMLAKGISGYILKNDDLQELKQVFENIGRKGYHYKEPDYGRLLQYVQRYHRQKPAGKQHLPNEKEAEFLRYLATELTYKEIAEKMHVSTRTVEGFRNILCEKLKIKTRIGLVIYAIRKGIVSVN